MKGGCDSGDYFEMVPQWHEQSLQQDNIHFMLYEDMKSDINRFVITFLICLVLHADTTYIIFAEKY